MDRMGPKKSVDPTPCPRVSYEQLPLKKVVAQQW